MDTPSPNRPTSKRNRELNVERSCSKCLNQMDPNAFAASSQVMKPGCTFLASLTNGPIRCGWLLTRRDQLCFDQISRVRSDCFPFFSNTQGPVMVDIPPKKSTLTAACCVEMFTRSHKINTSAAPNRWHQ